MSVPYEERAVSALEQLGLSVACSHLDQVAQQAAAHGWSYTHFLGYLLDAEVRERHRRTVELNLQFARFPYLKRLAEFDFAAQPGIDRRLIEELATGRFLYEGRNLILLGPQESARPIWPSRWARSRRNWGIGSISPVRLTWRGA